jgi:hypothetical protein
MNIIRIVNGNLSIPPDGLLALPERITSELLESLFAPKDSKSTDQIAAIFNRLDSDGKVRFREARALFERQEAAKIELDFAEAQAELEMQMEDSLLQAAIEESKQQFATIENQQDNIAHVKGCQYVCPIHRFIVREEPGVCSECQTKLEPKHKYR